jgi:putative membrane protein
MWNVSQKEDTGTNLAIDRTFLAHERTLMAWIRTSASLMSFGFTIYKFFQYLVEAEKFKPHTRLGPRGFALGMISVGIFALVVATIQHERDVKRMNLQYGRTQRSLAGKLGMLLSLCGAILLIAVLLRF